jgi:prefoldin subunit 4
VLLLSYHIGEVFFHLDGNQTQEMLESAKTTLQKEMETLKTEAKDIERLLSELKVQLYAKFGTSINLEAD